MFNVDKIIDLTIDSFEDSKPLIERYQISRLRLRKSMDQKNKIKKKRPRDPVLSILLPFFEFINTHFSHYNTDIIDKNAFEWTFLMEENFPLISSEINKYIQKNYDNLPNFQDLQSKQRLITSDDKWKTIFLYIFSEKIPNNCEEFPILSGLVNKIPGFNNVMISVLKPGKKLPLHRGLYNGFLRYHLPVSIPDSTLCSLKINNKIVNFNEGESIIFDDTFPHEAWNFSTLDRINLIIDFQRPLPKFFGFMNEVYLHRLQQDKDTQELIRNVNSFSLTKRSSYMRN